MKTPEFQLENKDFNVKEFIFVFLFFFSIFAISNQGFIVGEGGYHYRVADQIIRYGELGFSQPQIGVFITAPTGRIYAGHEIGNTLFMLPTALINLLIEKLLLNRIGLDRLELLKSFILSFNFNIYAALTASIFYKILRNGFSQRMTTSFFATFLLVFTTYFWTSSRDSFDGVLCSTLFTFSFFLLILYKEKPRSPFLIGSFICLGFCFITRISTIFLVIASFIYLFLILKNRFYWLEISKRMGYSVLTLLPFVIWQMWYNHLRTGYFYMSPVQTKQFATNNALDGNLLLGISGLLLSPGKSLFIYAPLLIISVILFKKFYQEYRKEAIYFLAVCLFWFLLHARLRSWYGAWGWGPRHFITILPVLFLPFAVNLQFVLRQKLLKVSSLLLGGFGFLLALSSIISNWQFRLTYAREQGRISDDIFVWGFTNNQAIDMLRAGGENIWRLITRAPAIRIASEYSEMNEYVSSTLNIWPNALIAAGIPWYVAIAALIPFLALLYFSSWNLIYLHSRDAE
ncbi:MAG: hypothetical protein SFW36_14015 [Leptolyngbyaceae cyanobacterium bins.59]|nr:hypothetical protein [Leptolyngbyaceae cyanobacterium bins.59]